MCGIAGYFGPRDNMGLLERMTRLMVHRGPDDEGFFVADGIGLGMRRLSIIDRTGGAQPIHNETKDICVIYNGEIYNHADLRTELEVKGHRFSCAADTEVLVHGYEEWGIEGLLNRLNGMFAFALYDQAAGCLLLGRDRLGIKPLYYTRKSGTLYFASEVKCFRAAGEISFQPNEAAIAEFLTLRYVPSPDTLFQDVRKLPGGHYMRLGRNGALDVTRYWYPAQDHERMSDDDYLERFGELFDDAVKVRLMSEVPLGAYLSEGLDSNLIAWTMSQHLDRPVSTYSIGFGGKYDETAGARASAKIIGTDHTEIRFDETNFDDLTSAIWHLDEPIGDAHVLPSFILAREAKKKLTVVLLGEGADESLFGYPFFKVSWLARALSAPFPSMLTEKAVPALIEAIPLKLLNTVFPMPAELGEEGRRHLVSFVKAARHGKGEEIFRLLSGLFSNADTSRLLLRPPTADPSFNLDYFAPDDTDDSPDGLLQQIHNAHFSGWLQDNILLRHDKMGMAHSVECRVPFLDHRLVEFMAGVPRRLKVSGWKDKILARRFARSRIHPDIAKRPKKPFFVPMERFVESGAFRDMVGENLSEERIRRRGHFRPEAVNELIHKAHSRDFLAVKRVMSLIILELWHRTFIDGELSPSPEIEPQRQPAPKARDAEA